MIIGIDLDGTITEGRKFFETLTYANRTYGGETHILTARGEEDRELTIEELKNLQIRYDHLHMVEPGDWAAKGRICEEFGIQILFEDMDEFIHHIPESTLVMKVRNAGNWANGMWLTKELVKDD